MFTSDWGRRASALDVAFEYEDDGNEVSHTKMPRTTEPSLVSTTGITFRSTPTCKDGDKKSFWGNLRIEADDSEVAKLEVLRAKVREMKPVQTSSSEFKNRFVVPGSNTLRQPLPVLLEAVAHRFNVSMQYIDALTVTPNSVSIRDAKRAFQMAIATLPGGSDISWSDVWFADTMYPDFDVVESCLKSSVPVRTVAFGKLSDRDNALVDTYRSRMCRHKNCKNRQTTCQFAHTFDELVPKVCLFDPQCRKDGCEFKHKSESKEQYVERLGWQMPGDAITFKKEQDKSMLTFSRVCHNVMQHGHCLRKVCTFAHTMDQYQPIACGHGNNCRFKTSTCSFQHPLETKEDLCKRIHVFQ